MNNDGAVCIVCVCQLEQHNSAMMGSTHGSTHVCKAFECKALTAAQVSPLGRCTARGQYGIGVHQTNYYTTCQIVAQPNPEHASNMCFVNCSQDAAWYLVQLAGM